MFQELQGLEIVGISACVPKHTVRNDFFEGLMSSKEIRIFEKTVGIHERRWADKKTTASDLGFQAANNLLDALNIDRSEIKCLLFLSQTPDYKIPFTSNILQDKLGFTKDILCLDINAGCAGFVQGLSLAFSLAKSIKEGKVLLIVAETLSKILSQKDRSTSMLFGDAASAILIQDTKNTSKVFINTFSDGKNASAIEIPDGGYRNEFSEESLVFVTDEKGNSKSRINLSMKGPEVFDFTLREIAPSIESLLEKSKISKDSIDYFLLHQSNQFIIKQIGAKLNVPSEKMLLNISQYGNTSGVSIPLLICSNPEKIAHSKKVVLSGYGSGLNWGNCLLDLSKTKILNITEY